LLLLSEWKNRSLADQRTSLFDPDCGALKYMAQEEAEARSENGVGRRRGGRGLDLVVFETGDGLWRLDVAAQSSLLEPQKVVHIQDAELSNTCSEFLTPYIGLQRLTQRLLRSPLHSGSWERMNGPSKHLHKQAT